ncbi:MAG: GntR family transcriptional regulator, partial [Lentihominibacter sp.]
MPKFKTLKDHVYDYIAEQIMEGRLKPSEKISEAAICEELSISRTPVREALIQLAGEEILENVPRKGFIIRHVDLKEAQELYEVIGQLDGLAAYNACNNLTEQDFKDMDFYIESMDLAINSENFSMYYRQQLEFHQVYISKCSNETLINEIERLRNKFIKKSYTTDSKG